MGFGCFPSCLELLKASLEGEKKALQFRCRGITHDSWASSCESASAGIVSWIAVIAAALDDKLTGEARAWAGCERLFTPCGLAVMPSSTMLLFVLKEANCLQCGSDGMVWCYSGLYCL